VDVDLYEPALDCCRFVWPRLNSGGVILFDDYGFPACRGERTAVDEFFAEMDCPVVTLPTGQGLVIKV
jgi:O-methyltransferase